MRAVFWSVILALGGGVAPLMAQITGPAEVEAGQLVVLTAEAGPSGTVSWLPLEPVDLTAQTFENGSALVFASGCRATTVVVACAMASVDDAGRPRVIFARHVVRVRDPRGPSPPEPSPPPSPTPPAPTPTPPGPTPPAPTPDDPEGFAGEIARLTRGVDAAARRLALPMAANYSRVAQSLRDGTETDLSRAATTVREANRTLVPAALRPAWSAVEARIHEAFTRLGQSGPVDRFRYAALLGDVAAGLTAGADASASVTPGVIPPTSIPASSIPASSIPASSIPASSIPASSVPSASTSQTVSPWPSSCPDGRCALPGGVR